jgi:hypothetical protein
LITPNQIQIRDEVHPTDNDLGIGGSFDQVEDDDPPQDNVCPTDDGLKIGRLSDHVEDDDLQDVEVGLHTEFSHIIKPHRYSRLISNLKFPAQTNFRM